MISQRLGDPWERVRDDLRSAIVAGELPPGTRLREVALSEQFGTSRGPVREAIRALEAEGLVVRAPRVGSMVLPLDRRAVDELYSMRLLLEPFAARRALTNRSGTLLVRLATALSAIRAASDRSAVVRPDIEFHSAFFVEAEHERLLRVWETMTGPLKILMALSSRRAPRELNRTVLGHEPVFAAVEAGDVEACVTALELHLRTAWELVAADLP